MVSGDGHFFAGQRSSRNAAVNAVYHANKNWLPERTAVFSKILSSIVLESFEIDRVIVADGTSMTQIVLAKIEIVWRRSPGEDRMAKIVDVQDGRCSHTVERQSGAQRLNSCQFIAI